MSAANIVADTHSDSKSNPNSNDARGNNNANNNTNTNTTNPTTSSSGGVSPSKHDTKGTATTSSNGSNPTAISGGGGGGKDSAANAAGSPDGATTAAASSSGGGGAAAAATSYFPSQEVAIGTLVRSFIVDGVYRDHFPLLSPSSTAVTAGASDGVAAASSSPTPSGAAATSSSPSRGGTAAAASVTVNEDGSTSHPPNSDERLLTADEQLQILSVARDLLQSLRQPADVPLYTRCSTYSSNKRRLLCSPDITPEEIRSTVPHQYLALFAVDVPAISLTAFAIRLVQRMHCGIDAFIWAIGLMFRVSSKIPVCSRSVHRMLLAASVISAKCRNDIYYSMSFYAGVGGVARSDLRAMEVAMLTALDFTAFITARTYVDLLYSMRQHCAQLTHTYKKAWASEAWAAFIVAVPLAHQAAFDAQAAMGPPPTPPHLKRHLIRMPARTKPHSSKNKGGASTTTEQQQQQQPIVNLGPALSEAKKTKSTEESPAGITTGSVGSTGGETNTNASTIVTAPTGGGTTTQQRMPQGPAGSAFAPSTQQQDTGSRKTGQQQQKSYAYYAATGDDNTDRGSVGDGNSSSGGAGGGGGPRVGVKIVTSGTAFHPMAAAGQQHPQLGGVAALGSKQQQPGTNTNITNQTAQQQPIIPESQRKVSLQNHTHRPISLQPAGLTSPNNNDLDVRSMHSSLDSFSGMAGDMSNSNASANMRLVGIGPVVRAITLNPTAPSAHPNNDNYVPKQQHPQQQQFGSAIGGGGAPPTAAAQQLLFGGGGGGGGFAHPSATAGGNAAAVARPSGGASAASATSGVVGGMNPSAGGGGGAPPPFVSIGGGGGGGGQLGVISGGRQRYVPSANTSMNSFSDYSSSAGDSDGHRGVGGGMAAPRLMVHAGGNNNNTYNTNNQQQHQPSVAYQQALAYAPQPSHYPQQQLQQHQQQQQYPYHQQTSAQGTAAAGGSFASHTPASSSNSNAYAPILSTSNNPQQQQLQQQQPLPFTAGGGGGGAYGHYFQQQQLQQQQQQHQQVHLNRHPPLPNFGVPPTNAVVAPQQQQQQHQPFGFGGAAMPFQQQQQQQQQQPMFAQHPHQHPSFSGAGGRH